MGFDFNNCTYQPPSVNSTNFYQLFSANNYSWNFPSGISADNDVCMSAFRLIPFLKTAALFFE